MKVLLVGPSKSGKSALASYLAGISDGAIPAQAPLPTVGCRILELERNGAPVELWDVSGDQSYENCWPAIKHNADGIIFVYSSEAPGQAVRARSAPPPTHAAPAPPLRAPHPTARPHARAHIAPQKELELFFEWFATKGGVPAERCACFALSHAGAGAGAPPAGLGGVQPESFMLRADGGEGARRAFDRFVGRLASLARKG
jgi:energy-coupling factor transporter ATP-binding protein EcfA2